MEGRARVWEGQGAQHRVLDRVGGREEEEGEIKNDAKDSGLGDWGAGHWPREHVRAGSLGGSGEKFWVFRACRR